VHGKPAKEAAEKVAKDPWSVDLGGSPRIYAGEERLSAPGKVRL